MRRQRCRPDRRQPAARCSSGVAYAEMALVACLLVVAVADSAVRRPPVASRCRPSACWRVAVPVGKLLLAGAPSAQQWVAQGPRAPRRAAPTRCSAPHARHPDPRLIGASLVAPSPSSPRSPTAAPTTTRSRASSTPSPDATGWTRPHYSRDVTDRHILTAVAWPYANGPRHIGHVSGFGVPSDVFSRYQRMAGNKVLMVSGTDEHGTPITVAADAEGITPREIADRNNRIIVDDLASLGLSYDLFTRTTTANHAADQPGDLPGPAQERLRLPEDDARRDQPVDRPHPARPLHRGHLPDLRLRRRPRRPVRQLRQPARPDRPDQPGQQDQRGDAEVRRGGALLPRPAGLRPRARRLARHPQELAAQRPELQRQPARRPQAAQLHPRHRLGRAGAARRLERPVGQAHLRLVRRRRRLPVGVDRVGPPVRRPRGLAAVVAVAGLRRLLLHGQGQHRLPLRDLARPAARLQRRGRQGRHPRLPRPAQPAHRGRLQRVPHDGGAQVLLLAAGRHLRARLPRPVRRRRAALLHRRRRPGEPGHRLHLGGVPAAATTTSSSPAGATWSTARCRWRPRTSAPSRRRGS